jgi:hypothetical protein
MLKVGDNVRYAGIDCKVVAVRRNGKAIKEAGPEDVVRLVASGSTDGIICFARGLEKL